MFYLNLNKYGMKFADWLFANDDVDCVWDDEGLCVFNDVDTKELYKQFKGE